MKVFISWSGALSKSIAGILADWLPNVIQSVAPFFSPDDIEKGQWWTSELIGQLKASPVGIICVTNENLNSQWMMFEAGALVGTIDKTRVCPILFGMSESNISGPLAFFQSSLFTEDDIRRTVKMMNSLSPIPLTEARLNSAFEKWWPDLKRRVDFVMSEGIQAIPKQRDVRDMLEEILTGVRALNRPRSSVAADVFFSLAKDPEMQAVMFNTLSKGGKIHSPIILQRAPNDEKQISLGLPENGDDDRKNPYS